MKDTDITAIVRTLKREVERWDPTAVGQVAEDSHDPFRILISCLLSLRTKDG
jgi:endonuclease-3